MSDQAMKQLSLAKTGFFSKLGLMMKKTNGVMNVVRDAPRPIQLKKGYPVE